MDEDRMTQDVEVRASMTRRWPIVAVVVLFCIATFTFGFALHEWHYAKQLTAENAGVRSALDQTESQMNALGGRLNALQSELAARAAEAPAVRTGESQRTTVHRSVARVHRRGVPDARWKKMQAQLADQQKQLTDTRQELASTRTELEGNLNSTRDTLNGSIARTHDELVALEKRGERNYYEFDLTKSKQFKNVGPISLSLRKVDTRHGHYNLEVLVNDASLSKKNVNLYEPLWFYSDQDSRQGLELVVNKIAKNRIHGYVSAPKYTARDLASTATGPNVQSPGPSTSVNPAAPPTLERRSEPVQ